MSEVVIKVDNLSKQYRLGMVGTGTLSHDLKRWWHKVQGKEDPFLKVGETNMRDVKGESDYVWALRNISFEVNKGEVLGVIGKNGAGKSTLLKLLSRITTPTTGEFRLKGRVASLLEVGTGFHPELTGSENIFLNGAVLGMTKAEIKSKFDEIVAFSGVERYIDTPVKRYSSGMYVRLAFAVAAHLEPEILIIDEVLAVGDAEFQKKCLGKMKDVAGEGRTVLFVSHNMTAVKSLCPRALYLLNGEINFTGNTEETISAYLGGNSKTITQPYIFNGNEFNNNLFTLKTLEVKSKNPDPSVITMNDAFSINVSLDKKETETTLDITFQVTDTEGNVLLTSGSGAAPHLHGPANNSGKLTYTCNFPANFFNQGEYGINLLFVENRKKVIEQLPGSLTLTILPGNAELGQWMGKSKGFFRLSDNLWEINHD